MAKTLIATIVLVAAGIALAVGGARLVTSGPAPEFGYGVSFFSPLVKDTAEGEPVLESGKRMDLEAVFDSLSAEQLKAAADALAPLEPAARLPLRLMSEVLVGVGESSPIPRSVLVAVVADDDADRVLAPLCGTEGAAAQLYVSPELPLNQVFSEAGLADSTKDLPAANLPVASRCFGEMVLVRQSAVGRVGLQPKSLTPNFLVVTLPRAGQLQESLRLALPLRTSHKMLARPWDLVLPRESVGRWLGVAGLALILMAGAVFIVGLAVYWGAQPPPMKMGLDALHEAAQLLGRHRHLFYLVQAVMILAVVLGCAVGVPGPSGHLWQQQRFPAPLALVDLPTAGIEGTAILSAVLLIFLAYFFVCGLVLVGLPSLFPGLGAVTAVLAGFLWGVALAPSTLTLLERLPYRGIVMAFENQAYTILALGGWIILIGLIRPKTLGAETHFQGYKVGVSVLYRLIPAAAALLLVAAILVGIFLGVLSQVG
jgi:hypothetical protein